MARARTRFPGNGRRDESLHGSVQAHLEFHCRAFSARIRGHLIQLTVRELHHPS